MSDSWTAYKHVDAWVAMSGQMNSRSKDGSKVVNMAIAGTMSEKFIYNEKGEMPGKASRFSVEIGNYYGNTVLYFKIVLIDKDGNYVYVKGDADNYVTLEVTTSLDVYKAAFRT